MLLADQNLPLPGPHRADDDAYRLTARIKHRWAAQLDRLIERCTDHDPARRLSLREVADELTAMLTPTAEAAVPDVDDLERRLAMMAEPRRRQDERRDSFRAQLIRAWDRIVAEVAEPAYEVLAARLSHFEQRHDDNVAQPRAMVHIPSIQIGNDSWGASILAPGGGRARVDLGVTMRVRDRTGRVVVGAVLQVNRYDNGLGRSEAIIEDIYETTVDSAQFETTLAQVSTAFTQRLPEALRVLLAAMEAENGPE